MIGQHLDALHVVERADEACQLVEQRVVVGDAGHEHVAYPHGLARVRQVAGAIQNVAVGVAGEPPVAVVADMLEVEQHGVGVSHQFFKLREPRLAPREGLRRGVETGVDAALVGLGEELDEEIHL